MVWYIVDLLTDALVWNIADLMTLDLMIEALVWSVVSLMNTAKVRNVEDLLLKFWCLMLWT
jgi:hypothetical protein